MGFDFKAAAQEVVGGSFIINGREKVAIPSIIADYPEGVTIVGADLLTDKDGEKFSALIIGEDNGVYFFGGKALTDIVKKWAAKYDGDCEVMSADLLASGGVAVKLDRTKTKNGRDFTSVSII